MANKKVEICLKKKTHPEHKYSVTFVSKVGTIMVQFTRRNSGKEFYTKQVVFILLVNRKNRPKYKAKRRTNLTEVT